MAEIRVVFYEVFDDGREGEDLIEFLSSDDPDYKKGDQFSLIEAEFIDASDIKKLGDINRKPTHEIVHTSSPVIVYTGRTAEERSVISKIYIYYLKKIDHSPGLPLSTIASMLP